jgi:hypothetical protein
MSVPAYRTVLVPLDGSTLAERALPYATAVARASGARLLLVRVAEGRTVPEAVTWRAGTKGALTKAFVAVRVHRATGWFPPGWRGPAAPTPGAGSRRRAVGRQNAGLPHAARS